MQILLGPRQAGKTTLVQQVLESIEIPSHYCSADEPTLQSRTWIEQQWEIGRLLAKGQGISIEDFMQRPLDLWLAS